MDVLLKVLVTFLALYAAISYVVVGVFILWTFGESVVDWWTVRRKYGLPYDDADPIVLIVIFVLWFAAPVLILPLLSDFIKESWRGIKPKVLAAL